MSCHSSRGLVAGRPAAFLVGPLLLAVMSSKADDKQIAVVSIPPPAPDGQAVCKHATHQSGPTIITAISWISCVKGRQVRMALRPAQLEALLHRTQH